MKRLLLILLCSGVLSLMSGCYVTPYPYAYYPAYGGADVSISIGKSWGGYGHHHHGYYGGYRYGAYSGRGYGRWHR